MFFYKFRNQPVLADGYVLSLCWLRHAEGMGCATAGPLRPTLDTLDSPVEVRSVGIQTILFDLGGVLVD